MPGIICHITLVEKQTREQYLPIQPRRYIENRTIWVFTRQARSSGHLFDDVGRFYQVKSIYRDILSKDPACEPGRHRPGVLDFQAGQVVAALKLIGSAAVLGSNNGVFSMSLASTLRCARAGRRNSQPRATNVSPLTQKIRLPETQEI